MSKKILIISSSPRKGGNSDTLCDAFAKGASEAGHQAAKIFLKEKNIHYCTGCGLCVTNKGTCSQKDDMEELQKKMLAADVIVLATPIYFYTMAGQMKTFIDRNCSFYTMLGNKEFYYIMTAADTDKNSMNRTVEEFRGFLSCLDHAKERDILYGTGVWEKGDADGSKHVENAVNMGRNV